MLSANQGLVTIDELHRPTALDIRLPVPLQDAVAGDNLQKENSCTAASKGHVMNIKTIFLYSCNETCKMNVSAVRAANQNPKIVHDQRKPRDPTPCVLPSNGCVWTGHDKRKEENQHFQRAYNGP